MNKIVFFDTYSDASGGAPKSMLQLMLLLEHKKIMPAIVTTARGSLYEKGRSVGFSVSVFKPPSILMKRRKDINGGMGFYLKYIFSLFFFWGTLFFKAYEMRNEKICFNDIRCFLFFLPFVIFCRRNLIWYVRINDRVKFVTDLAVRASSKIILISNACNNMFTKNEKEKYKKKFSTVYTGFPHNKSKVFIKEEKIKIGFVGVLSKRKNIELLIDALSHISVDIISKLEIVVVGDTKTDEKEYLLDIKAQIKKYNLSEQFKFIGYVNDVSSLYATFDSVVMTSFAEGLPRTLIEGLSQGCYVISTDVDGAKEIILDNYLGVILDEYSSTKLAEEITNMMANRNEILTDRDKRSEYVNANFSEESFVNNFIAVVID